MSLSVSFTPYDSPSSTLAKDYYPFTRDSIKIPTGSSRSYSIIAEYDRYDSIPLESFMDGSITELKVYRYDEEVDGYYDDLYSIRALYYNDNDCSDIMSSGELVATIPISWS